MEASCLGLSILGSCKYLHTGESWSIISIGDTISAIALLLAFSQLQSLTRKEVIRTGLKKTYWLWGFGVFFILLSSVLPFIPEPVLPLVSYPIFWQFMASLFFLTAIIILIVLYHSSLKFGGRHSSKTIEISTRVIIKGHSQDLSELSSLLGGQLKG